MSENNDYESELDGSFFEQAITIAENIPTNLSPRPPVGALITKNGNIIGKGSTSIITLTADGILTEFTIFLVKTFKFFLLFPFKSILYLN